MSRPGTIGYDVFDVLVKKDVDKGTCFSSVVNRVNHVSTNVPVKKLDGQSCRNLQIRRISARVLLAFEPISFWLGGNGLISSGRYGYVVQEIAARLACSVAENSHR